MFANIFKRDKDINSNPMKVYGGLVFEHFSKGLQDKPVDLNYVSNQLCYNKVITSNYIEYYFQISSFGDDLSYGLLESTRNLLRKRYGRKVYVDLITENLPHRIKWSSTAMQNNLSVWRSSRKRARKEKAEEGAEGFSSAVTDKIYNRQARLEASWEYFKGCEERRIETELTTVALRIRISKDDIQYTGILFESINEVFDKSGISISPIKLYIYDFLQLISPFRHETTKLARTLVSNRVLTTEITASFSPLTQGKLDDGNIILGNDIKNRQLVKIENHPKDQSGTNILVLGETGSGKSCLIKTCLEQFLANGDYIYITDYEGNEYTPFGDTYGAVYLDFRGDDGKYYEPLRLTNITGDKELDKGIVQNAINGVYQLCSVLMGTPLSAEQKNVLSEIIVEAAQGRGVDLNNQATWKNSENLTIRDLLPKLENRIASKKYITTYGDDITELYSTLKLYFNGVYSFMFKQPISFNELKDAKIIITRFGADSTSSVTGSESIDTRVKQLTKMLLDSELARYRRSKNQSFIMLYEELQRYLTHDGAADWTNTIWTGIRKCNGTCIGIINDPGKLNQNISALINNSEYFIIGKTKDLKALEYMFENPDLKKCRPLIESLINLNRCFLLKHKRTTSIFHCELPKAYLASPIFSTRSDANSTGA